MGHPLSVRQRAGARLRYRRDRFRLACLKVTGRCPGCRQRKGQHKFGCSYRPGKGLKFTVKMSRDR